MTANPKQGAATAWLTPQEYKNPVNFFGLAEKKELADFTEYPRGSWAIGDVDLSKTTDLMCTRAVIMHFGNPNKYTLSVFHPGAKAGKLRRQGRLCGMGQARVHYRVRGQ